MTELIQELIDSKEFTVIKEVSASWGRTSFKFIKPKVKFVICGCGCNGYDFVKVESWGEKLILFEEAIELYSPNIQRIFLYHLDLFTKKGVIKL